MEISYQFLIDKINEYSIITLFRHEVPDVDAVGSQLGLKEWIMDNFKDKQVFVCGFEQNNIYPIVDGIRDIDVKKSLAIVLDTANTDRIDDKRALTARELIRIDHHPKVEDFGILSILNDKASSTCEIITDIIFSFAWSKVSEKCAEYLYGGILTDTVSFTTTNTTANTFAAAIKLLNVGIKPNVCYEKVFRLNYKQFKSATYVRDHHILDNGVAYTILDEIDLDILEISGSTARLGIVELSGVDEIRIWCIFTHDDDGLWHGSIRSRYIPINHIVAKYGGGGHKNSCGCKIKNKEEIFNLIDELKCEIVNFDSAKNSTNKKEEN